MIEVSSNVGAVSVNYAEAPNLVSKTVFRTLDRIGKAMVGFVKESFSGAGIGPAHERLNYRTRTLSRAIFSRVDRDEASRDAVVVLGADTSTAPYARVQEYGGTIKPTHGKFLTIPVGVNLTGNGVMRVSPREFIKNPGGLGFQTSFVNKRKTAIMGAARGRKPEPVFALKTSVTLPDRSYLRSMIRDKREWIMGQLGIATDEAIHDLGDTGA